jgi:glycosyltransferase involved in cell wall biosynthesis
MENTPLVSVIIPLHNAEHFIVATVNSAINQTWGNIEIIIIDDGSTDDSLSVVRSFQDARIIIISQSSKGASAARNRGLAVARGKYIQFLDADDLLSDDKIAKQVLLLEGDPGKIAVCSTVHFFDGSEHLAAHASDHDVSYIRNDNDPVHFLINLWGGYCKQGSMVQPNAWLTPRSIIDKAGGWNELLTVNDDGEFFTRVILNSSGILKTEGTNYYRKYFTSKNLSAQKNLMGMRSRLNAILLKKNHLFSFNNSVEARVAIHKLLIDLACVSYLQFPEIYRQAIDALPDVSVAYTPPLGGTISNTTARIVGWRLTLRIKAILRFR